MERDRGVSRERPEHVRTIQHIRGIQARDAAILPISRVE